jgi:hypothetical protein
MGKRGGGSNLERNATAQIAEARFQPSDPARTYYRLSTSPLGLSLGNDSSFGAATVARESVPISLGLTTGRWRSRGEAQLGVAGSESANRVDAIQLLKAGGVDVCALTSIGSPAWSLKWLTRSHAEVFFYSGNGNAAGCLSRVQECAMAPADLQPHWRKSSNLRVLILAAPNLLAGKFNSGMVIAGPAVEWAKFMKNKAHHGSLVAILGYADDAPDIGSVGKDIAEKMGKKIAAGLKDDAWVKTWLNINGDHPGKNTWNAVGIDEKGYWWIHDRTAWEQSFDTFPGFGAGWEIKGPAPIM